jgi:hypothetical protein
MPGAWSAGMGLLLGVFAVAGGIAVVQFDDEQGSGAHASDHGGEVHFDHGLAGLVSGDDLGCGAVEAVYAVFPLSRLSLISKVASGGCTPPGSWVMVTPARVGLGDGSAGGRSRAPCAILWHRS